MFNGALLELFLPAVLRPSVPAICHGHLSRPSVTATCHGHLSRPSVAAICHGHLSRPSVTALSMNRRHAAAAGGGADGAGEAGRPARGGEYIQDIFMYYISTFIRVNLFAGEAGRPARGGEVARGTDRKGEAGRGEWEEGGREGEIRRRK